MTTLTQKELIQLLKSVFPHKEWDKKLAILIDVPKNEKNDKPLWQERRKIAQSWYTLLAKNSSSLSLECIDFFAYADVGSNNADLPDTVYKINNKTPDSMIQIKDAESNSLKSFFSDYQQILALTQYSATAPLKVAAKQYGFRAATMPGFTVEMVPALKVDINIVTERVNLLKNKLDFADMVKVEFVVDDETTYKVNFDLFQRTAHASSGRFDESGTAGNLPSGESYIVPYEGGLGAVSQSKGYLPVQFGDEVVVYRIRQNKVTKIISDGKKSRQEWKYVKSEPAYGNIAELGFGVMADFGLVPIGEVLLDEKLGFHIAFGRSDHFGGITGPEQFSSPGAVVHLDRIYLPETQPRIKVKLVEFLYSGGKSETIIKDGSYQMW